MPLPLEAWATVRWVLAMKILPRPLKFTSHAILQPVSTCVILAYMATRSQKSGSNSSTST